mmetsp:Transcript_30560/g.67088  ORF Transcript_30560/g.67088 Transcript_30560/m.67088 type:complete len:689 (-) Transcript_30560:36-2102(-)
MLVVAAFVGSTMPCPGRGLLADNHAVRRAKARGTPNVVKPKLRRSVPVGLGQAPAARSPSRTDAAVSARLHGQACTRCRSKHSSNLVIACSLCGFRVHGSCAYPPMNNMVAKLVASKSVGWHCWACEQEAAILQQFDVTIRSCKKRWADEFCQECGVVAEAPCVKCELCGNAFHRSCVREYEECVGWRCRPCRPRNPDVTIDKWAVQLVWADRYIPVIRGVNVSQSRSPWSTSEVVFRLSRNVLITRTGRIIRLCGPHNKALALQLGFPAKLCSSFASGFPRRWALLLKYSHSPLPRLVTQTLGNRYGRHSVAGQSLQSSGARPRSVKCGSTPDRTCVAGPDWMGQLLNLPDRVQCTTEQPPSLLAGGRPFLPSGVKVKQLFVQGWLNGVVVDGGLLHGEDVAVVLCEDCRFLTLSARELAEGLKSGQMRILDTVVSGATSANTAAPSCGDSSISAPVGWTASEFDLLSSSAREIPAAAKDFWQQVAARVGKPSEECQSALDCGTTPITFRAKGTRHVDADMTPQLQRGSGPRRFSQIRRYLGYLPGLSAAKDDFVLLDCSPVSAEPRDVCELHTGATPCSATKDVCSSPDALRSPGLRSCDDLLGGTRHASVDTFMHDMQTRRKQVRRGAPPCSETTRKIRVLDCRRVLSMLRNTDTTATLDVDVDDDVFETVVTHDAAEVGGLLSV